ncbi:MAG: ABC transporter permease [Solirubrobacterales bacterium]|nr:ABC transporter permease [Solirubrobacterales bacterium]
MRARVVAIGKSTLIAVVPIVLALVVMGILLAALGRDPFTFYADMFQRGLFEWQGFQESIIRSAPLLLIAAGLIVAFRASLWNLGGDGQFLLGAALTAGLAPSLLDALGVWPMLLITMAIAMLVGGAWTIIPAVLRGRYGVNEIITTLMMSFIGIGVANVLVKGPFRTDVGGVARTDVVPFDERFPLLFGTRIHLGFVIGLIAILAVHVLMTRTSLGLRMRILGASPRAALHAGLNPLRLTVIAFVLSGALIGLSGSVEILGVQGSFRADFNPAYGLLVIPLVFLARLNAIGSLALVIVFSVIQIGGESAAREADVTSDVLLVLVGLMLLFMAVVEYLRVRRGLGMAFVPPEVADRLRPPGGEGGGGAQAGEPRPALGAEKAGSR